MNEKNNNLNYTLENFISKYKPANYSHFDGEGKCITHDVSKILINDFSKNPKDKKFNFFPFIHYCKKNFQYKLIEKGKRKKGSKEREIMYSSHLSRFIYSCYAYTQLMNPYEEKLKELDLSDCVVAYRKGKNNIECFTDTVKFINRYESCMCLCFDIEAFFDNIGHKKLKEEWCSLLVKNTLPDDHFKIFSSITKYKYISRGNFNKYFTYNSKNRKKRLAKDFFCKTTKSSENNKRYKTAFDMFKQIKKADKQTKQKYENLKKDSKELIIKQNPNNYGIPQGSSISGFLSNMYMLDFDKKIYLYLKDNDNDCLYRRYSDDILFIIKIDKNASDEILESFKQTISNKIEEILKNYYDDTLKLKTKKTETVVFKDLKIYKPSEQYKNTFSYLGFSYNGNKISLKDSTISRHYKKINYKIKKLGKFILKNSEENTKVNLSINMINHNYLSGKKIRIKKYIKSLELKEINTDKLNNASSKYGNIHDYLDRFVKEAKRYPDEINAELFKDIYKPLKNTKRFIKNRVTAKKESIDNKKKHLEKVSKKRRA